MPEWLSYLRTPLTRTFLFDVLERVSMMIHCFAGTQVSRKGDGRLFAVFVSERRGCTQPWRGGVIPCARRSRTRDVVQARTMRPTAPASYFVGLMLNCRHDRYRAG